MLRGQSRRGLMLRRWVEFPGKEPGCATLAVPGVCCLYTSWRKTNPSAGFFQLVKTDTKVRRKGKEL